MRKLLLSLLSLIFLLPSLANAQDISRNSHLFYAFTSPNGNTSLCWLIFSDANEEICVSVPEFSYYAVSPTNIWIAFIQTANGQIHLLHIPTRQIVSLELCQPQQDFLWDDYYQRSGSLIWSPDSILLAFTGAALGDLCEESGANAYIYNVGTENLMNLSADLSGSTSRIMPASWSPDGEWLSLYGAWDDEVDMEPNWGSALVSVNTLDFRRIAPSSNTCRLVWSPNMSWLASNTDCVEGIGNGSDLIFIPFASQPLESSGLYLDNLVTPLTFGWRPITGWTSLYSSPLWLDDSKIVTYRSVSPITFGYISAETYTSTGIVIIDVKSISEELVFATNGVNTLQTGHWLIIPQPDGYGAYNLLTNEQISIPTTIISCLIRGSLAITDDGEYLAGIDNCSTEQSASNLTVYATDDFDNFLVQRTFDTQAVKFLENQPQ